MDQSDSGMGPVVGCCERNEELSDSIKAGEFLGKLCSITLSKATCCMEWWARLLPYCYPHHNSVHPIVTDEAEAD